MDDKVYKRFPLADRSYANIVKRDITRLAESKGFSETEVGHINIVVSEMASNLLKFSPEGGELLVKYTPSNALEIICLDNGPGIKDLARMLQDGSSTSGTAGEGLGAIMRQSHDFDIYSQPGCGTAILSRVYKDHLSAPTKTSTFDVAALLIPKPAQTDCGDNFTFLEQGRNCYLIALDGLGHGSSAREASAAAVSAFSESPTSEPAVNLRYIHSIIRKTRGAVGTIVHINNSQKRISYCGIGNIAGRLFTLTGPSIANASSKSIIAYNGILGHNIPGSLNNHTLDWGPDKLLILHSDGIKSRWDLSKYTHLHRHDASLIAAVLYRDFTRGSDDTLVVVVRQKS